MCRSRNTKDVLEKRKMLLLQLIKERNKGNFTYLKYIKLNEREKRNN